MEWQTGLNGKTTKIKQWLNNTLHEDSTLTALLTAVYGENVPLEDLNLEELKGRQAELQITPNAKP